MVYLECPKKCSPVRGGGGVTAMNGARGGPMAAAATSKILGGNLEAWLAPSLAGLSLFCLICVFGFEEPNEWLLLVAVTLTLAAPAAVFVHLYRTRRLTAEEKRFWLREFTSLAAPSALADYLSATDYQTVTRTRMEQRSRRQTSSRQRQ
jgi:hypothetical protein